MSKRASFTKAVRRSVPMWARLTRSRITELVEQLAQARDRHGHFTPIDQLEPRMMFSATLSGRVFADGDRDGLIGIIKPSPIERVQGTGEATVGDSIGQLQPTVDLGLEKGLAGWTVFLDRNLSGTLDSGELTTLTARDGSYQFDDLPDGFHDVGLIPQAGWEASAPLGGIQTVTISDSTDATEIDFGVHRSVFVTAPTPHVTEGRTFAVDLSVESLPATGKVAVDWGDGDVEEITGKTNRLTHTYEQDGEYEVTVVTVDDTGRHEADRMIAAIGDTRKGRYKPGVGFEFEDLVGWQPGRGDREITTTSLQPSATVAPSVPVFEGSLALTNESMAPFASTSAAGQSLEGVVFEGSLSRADESLAQLRTAGSLSPADEGMSGLTLLSSSTADVLPIADAYVRGGSYANDNYGYNDGLLIKHSTATYSREVFL